MNQIVNLFKGFIAWVILISLINSTIPDNFQEHPRLYATVFTLLAFLALVGLIKIGKWIDRTNDAVNKLNEFSTIVKKIDRDLTDLEDRFIFFNTFDRLNRMESSFFERLDTVEKKIESLKKETARDRKIETVLDQKGE